jgi:hypothetical protein
VRRDEKRLIAAAAYCGPLGNTIYVMPPYCVREDDRDERRSRKRHMRCPQESSRIRKMENLSGSS